MKTLSIVIPAYNAQNYLSRCLDSFININNLDDLEILIVNDGSKDDTEVVAKKYCELYPDIIRLINKENGNVGSVYNESIKYCKGKYYKELDADDYFDCNGLIQLIDYLKNSDVDIVLNNYDIVDEKGNITKNCKAINNDKYNQELLLKEDINIINLAMHSITYKTSILKNLPESFDENCYYVDSEYVIYPLYVAKNFIALDYVVYKYLVGTSEQSININNFIKNVDQHKKVLISCLNYYDKYLKNIELDDAVKYLLLNLISTHFIINFKMKDKDVAINNLKDIFNLLKNNFNDYYLYLTKVDRKAVRLALWLDKNNYRFYNIVSNIIRYMKG